MIAIVDLESLTVPTSMFRIRNANTIARTCKMILKLTVRTIQVTKYLVEPHSMTQGV